MEKDNFKYRFFCFRLFQDIPFQSCRIQRIVFYKFFRKFIKPSQSDIYTELAFLFRRAPLPLCPKPSPGAEILYPLKYLYNEKSYFTLCRRDSMSPDDDLRTAFVQARGMQRMP